MDRIIGYTGIGPEEGIFIPIDEAFPYAMAHIIDDKDAQEELIDWFFSGNYLPVKEVETDE